MADEVKGIMEENVEKVIQRGEKTDELEKRSIRIVAETEKMKTMTGDLRKKYYWKNLKTWLIVGSVITVVIIVITVAVVMSNRTR